MSCISTIKILRERAKLEQEEALQQVLNSRKLYTNAVAHLNQLISYKLDYCKQLENSMLGIGLKSNIWINYQCFISFIYKAITNHSQQLSMLQSQVDLAISQWQQKKQRFNVFEILKKRSDTAHQLQKNLCNQKQMDELALRISLRKVKL